MLFKILFYVDYSISFFKEIATCIKSRSHVVVETHNCFDADLVVILEKPSIIKKTILNVRKFSHSVPILTIPNSSLLNELNGIYFLNHRLLDLNVNVFLNNLSGLDGDVIHVDCQFGYKGINLRSEMVGILSVVNEIHKITNIKFYFNDNNCLHVTGNSNGFSFSCFISNCSPDFKESYTVYTKTNGVFRLGGTIMSHNYSERYGACWDDMVECLCKSKFNLLKQENIIDILKIDRSLGCSNGAGRSRSKGFGPKFGRPVFA